MRVWLGTGTGNGYLGVGRGKVHWGEGKHEKRTGWLKRHGRLQGEGVQVTALPESADCTLRILGSHNRFFFSIKGTIYRFKFILFQCTPVQVLPKENLSCNCSHDFKAEHC